MSPKVLVTGANGSVGLSLYGYLKERNVDVVAGLRASKSHSKNAIVYGDISKSIQFNQKIDVVVHTAALAHQLKGAPDRRYFEINASGTQHVIEAGVEAGMKRFIYISTIKVLGEQTLKHAFTELTKPHPLDAYAKSKLAAEEIVLSMAKRYGFEPVIIRPPLVVGAGKIQGNIASLLGVVKKGIPLPLNSLNNQRSMCHIVNLCSFIACCIQHPKAAGETFLISDYDFSTPEFIKMLAKNHHLNPRLFACPKGVLRLLGTISGNKSRVEKLIESLVIEPKKAHELLGWTPDHSVYLS